MKTVVKPIIECASKRSDHNNGFFIQAETWGSCFHRISSRSHPDEIFIKFNRKPKCFHTYTKFPARVANLIFHVYVNYEQETSVLLDLSPGSRLIGFDQPQPSGEYLNRSFLILSPSCIKPEIFEYVPEYGIEEDINTFFFQHGQEREIYPCNEGTFFKGREVQHLYLDAAGYQTIPQAAGKDKFDIVPPSEGDAKGDMI